MTKNPAVHAAIESPELAKIFLKEHPEVWHSWVGKDAGKKVEESLQG
jgi:glycine betaine/proline transport system substrate-binding protein